MQLPTLAFHLVQYLRSRGRSPSSDGMLFLASPTLSRPCDYAKANNMQASSELCPLPASPPGNIARRPSLKEKERKQENSNPNNSVEPRSTSTSEHVSVDREDLRAASRLFVHRRLQRLTCRRGGLNRPMVLSGQRPSWGRWQGRPPSETRKEERSATLD